MTRTQLEELAKRLEAGHAKVKALARLLPIEFEDSVLLEAAAAIRSLLAQEPVAWAYPETLHRITKEGWITVHDRQLKKMVPLYAAPVPAIDVDEAMRLADEYATACMMDPDAAQNDGDKSRAALAAYLNRLKGQR